MTEAYLEIVCFITQAFPEHIAQRILFHLHPRLPRDLNEQIRFQIIADSRVVMAVAYNILRVDSGVVGYRWLESSCALMNYQEELARMQNK